METQNTSYDLRMDISNKLINHGFANDAYFLITMGTGMLGNQGFYELLIKSVEKQNKPIHARSFSAMANLYWRRRLPISHPALLLRDLCLMLMA